MIKKIFSLALMGLWLPLAIPAGARGEALLSLERAVDSGKQLAASGNVLAAAQAIRLALVYERSVVGRRYDVASSDSELLISFMSFVEPSIAGQVIAGGAQARSETRRRLILALSAASGTSGDRRIDGVTDDDLCRTVRDFSDLRPADIRQSLGLILASSAGAPPCLAQSLFFNTQIRAEDTAILGQLGRTGDPQAVTALVRQLVNVGRFAEALGLGVHIRDDNLRSQVERAIISARQLTSLKLTDAETSRAILDAVFRRAGTERLVFGSLLAVQAAPEFWVENAGAIRGFLATIAADDGAAILRDVWSRQMLARGGYELAVRAWTAAPELIPTQDFLAAFFFLREDSPAITGPSDRKLGVISLTLRRLATAARLSRLTSQQSRAVLDLFRALLDSYPSPNRQRLSALDAGFLAVAAERVELSLVAGNQTRH
jgi:hypothetical protein